MIRADINLCSGDREKVVRIWVRLPASETIAILREGDKPVGIVLQ
jgi:hypothetical protein